ncbi:MAG: glycosyltransferase family 4 protein [Planctomycetes bacterium]|nr:glycosyltransferase family 4 protein [Planctomycetota bacterium]
MRVLHLFSDWKWTGPAEPTVNLCLALRSLGHETVFACRRPPARVERAGGQSILAKARARGLEPDTTFALDRYLTGRGLLENARDLRLLTRVLERGRFDLLHCHLSHDHCLGGLAARRARLARPIPILRTNHKGVPLAPHLGHVLLMNRLTDGYVSVSRAAAIEDGATFSLPPERVWSIEGAVDLERFRPERPARDLRPELGLGREDVVVGIVARMQRHRRFDVFLRAVALAAREVPNLKALVVGRGTHRESVAIRPARELGIADRVVFSGYRSDDYVDALATLDFKVFLVPGSDGSCRAVREVMAMGRPAVVARRGMLPEIVEDGRTGLVVDDTPERLAEAMVTLARRPDTRREMGRAARRAAESRFGLSRQASELEAIYRELVRLGGRG